MSKKTLQKKKFQSLKNIIDNSSSLAFLPVVTDKTIQVNSYVITEKIDGYYVSNTDFNNLCDITATKSAALALVKNKLRKGTLEDTIHRLDYVISKNKLDELYYKQTLRKSKNKTKKFATQTRLSIAQQDIHMARQELLEIIFNF